MGVGAHLQIKPESHSPWHSWATGIQGSWLLCWRPPSAPLPPPCPPAPVAGAATHTRTWPLNDVQPQNPVRLQNKLFSDFLLLFNNQFWSLGLKVLPLPPGPAYVCLERRRGIRESGERAFGVAPALEQAQRLSFPPADPAGAGRSLEPLPLRVALRAPSAREGRAGG